MLAKFYRLPLFLLVVIAVALSVLVYLSGLTGLITADLGVGEFRLGESIASLAKASLFAPLKPLMYALIILSIGSSLAISRGGLGAKFIRVLAFFLTFSTIGAIVCIVAYLAFANLEILPDPALATGEVSAKISSDIPYAAKIFNVITSELMISIYIGIVFGYALKRLEFGREADKISDLFQIGFRKFLQFTIPLAVFGSVSIALSKPGGVESLSNLIPFGFVLRAVFPQAVVAISTSSSIATLPATKTACDQLGVDADEATPFFTIGATVNMVGTVMGLVLLSVYTIKAYGLTIGVGDLVIVALQSLIYSVSAAGVPSAYIVLLGDILTSHGVSPEYATYVVALIITMDTLVLDRLRTVLNTQSDSMSSAMGLHIFYKNSGVVGKAQDH